MNLSYQWLRELVGMELSAEELAAELTAAGCNIEGVHPAGEDVMLEAEVTTNRPDWLCHWGVAHEVAAVTGAPLSLPTISLPAPGPESIRDLTTVANEAEDLCPRYTARLIRGVTVGPSPDWLARRLESIGLQPRNNVVDITNYVLYETNQPLHAFDFQRLAEQRIVVRHAREGERFVSVFGEERKLSASMCVIADAEGPVALAGVKGGEGSAVTEATTDILLEAAYFDPAATRRTSRRAQLDSDSSYRFERGIDPGGVARASARAAQLICEIAGGTLVEGLLDTNPDLARPWEVTMRFGRCDRLLGLAVPRDEIERIFGALGLETAERNEESITVRVPTFRQDLTREADLIEEVIRCHGYERVPTTLTMPMAVGHVSNATAARRRIVEVLVGLGYFECATDSFVPAAFAGEFRPLGREREEVAPARLRNPVREDRPCLRTSLLPSLLEVARVNRHAGERRLFELSRIFLPEGEELTEPLRLGLLDDRGPEYVRGAFEALVADRHPRGEMTVEPVLDELPGFAPGSIAALELDGVRLALWGSLSEELVEAHDLQSAPAVLTADADAFAAAPQAGRFFRPLPRFPAVERDIALVVPESVRWGEIEAAVWEASELAESVAFASLYRGKPVPGGKKSVAFTVTYRHPERSLTDEEANKLRDDLVAHLTQTFPDAALR
jgi:phenylalanyl-tRNA synthetase beta chain